MKAITILDGAMGSELESRGINLPPPLWSAGVLFSEAEAIVKLHREYAEAGAEILTAATFRATRYAFNRSGKKNPDLEAKKAIQQAITLAKSVASAFPGVLVAGSIAPCGDSYRFEDFPGEKEAKKNYQHLIENLEQAGADLLLLETFGRFDESAIALKIARQSKLPLWFSIILKDEQTLPDGSHIQDILELANKFSADAFLINCSSPIHIEAAIPILLNSQAAPRFGAYPNAGISDPFSNEPLKKSLSPARFADILKCWADLGLDILGGCCGSSPVHISEFVNRYNKEKKNDHHKN
ncbi:MAG TPA: homocysteine S-methyltransferase family protein [Candidatus Marinimicrobia bacterium]|nr:homocysteine S-methyltransferase family protein [Candidatus Neomarinimicrobiota bacterium]